MKDAPGASRDKITEIVNNSFVKLGSGKFELTLNSPTLTEMREHFKEREEEFTQAGSVLNFI